jgi:hypothetical protein
MHGKLGISYPHAKSLRDQFEALVIYFMLFLQEICISFQGKPTEHIGVLP